MATQSRPIELGAPAPDFLLTDPEAGVWSLDKIAGNGPFLIAFICNHCPYVVHIANALAAFGHDYLPKGLGIAAISANDVETYPQDGPDKMHDFAKAHGFAFPYLYDATQQTALAYQAVCTPDFFLFDKDRKLAYHGQFDATRPNRGATANAPHQPATGADLRAAADAVLAGRAPASAQSPSIGCSIKWKAGQEPAWA
jgi:peroxiredoxin